MASSSASIKNFVSIPYHGLLGGVEFVGNYLAELPIHIAMHTSTGFFKVGESVSHLFKGGVFALTSVASLGTRKTAVLKAGISLATAGAMVAHVYETILHLFNPTAEVPKPTLNFFNMSTLPLSKTSETLWKSILINGKTLNDPKKTLSEKEFGVRLNYLVQLVFVVVKTFLETIVGIIAIPLSLLTVGLSPTLNEYAYNSLLAPQIAANLFNCLMGLINPHSLISKRT